MNNRGIVRRVDRIVLFLESPLITEQLKKS